MAKKASAQKKAAKPVAKAATKKSAAPVKKAAQAKPAPKAKVISAKAAAKPAKAAVKAVSAAKPALMTKKGSEKAPEKVVAKVTAPKDQGDLLIEKAKEEMANINSAKVAAEKNAKIKPIKIERGNAADEKAKWQELNKRYGKDKAVAYKMTESFDALKPLQHKVLGWGFILSNENNRLEVLFENGIKMLISNYKPS